MRVRLVSLVAGAALLCALVAAPSSATAASCAPDSVSIADPDNDGKYLTPPEIAAVTVTVDSACNLTLTDAIANRPSGLRTYVDRLYWWLDIDNNPSTGRPSGYMAGVEYGLIMSSDGVQLVDRFGSPIANLPPAGPFAASVSAEAIGVSEGSTIRVVAYTQNAPSGTFFTDPPGNAGNYFDYASNPGQPPFLVRLRPAEAALPTAPSPAPTPVPSAPQAACVVPTVRGLTLAAARARLTAAHCAVGALQRHRARGRSGIVLGSAPAAGTTAAAGTKVAITVRARPRASR